METLRLWEMARLDPPRILGQPETEVTKESRSGSPFR
jgi:hypothetical protein